MQFFGQCNIRDRIRGGRVCDDLPVASIGKDDKGSWATAALKALRSIRRRFAVHLPVALPRQSHNVKWMQPSAFARHFNLDVSPCL